MRLSMIAEIPGCTNDRLRENLLAFNFAINCLLKKFSSFLQGKFFFLHFRDRTFLLVTIYQKILKTVSISIEKQSGFFRCWNGANGQESVESPSSPWLESRENLTSITSSFHFRPGLVCRPTRSDESGLRNGKPIAWKFWLSKEGIQGLISLKPSLFKF